MVYLQMALLNLLLLYSAGISELSKSATCPRLMLLLHPFLSASATCLEVTLCLDRGMLACTLTVLVLVNFIWVGSYACRPIAHTGL
jgi:hypothetical protein